MVEGYNIALAVDGKTLCGRTQDDLTIAAKVKESITKDDQGETQRQVTGVLLRQRTRSGGEQRSN